MTTTSLVLVGHEVGGQKQRRPKAKKVGDLIAFTDTIITINNVPNPASDPELGPAQHSGFCVLVREPNIWLCQAGFSLPPISTPPFNAQGGQLQARGLMNLDLANFHAAITGGTRDYHQAQGELNGTYDVNPTPAETTWYIDVETP
jgi:hypothetical protein